MTSAQSAHAATATATGAHAPLNAASSTSGYVPADGLQLHFLDYGTPGLPPMLCVHGGSAHAHWFDFVADGFTPRFHVRALDLRGHGDSQWSPSAHYSFDRYAADIAEAVERFDLRDFVLIGHSMGGMISLVYAAKYPGRLSRLIVVDTKSQLSAERVARMHEFGTRPARRYPSREELVSRYRLEPAGTHMAEPSVVRHMAEHSARQVEDGQWQHKSDRRVYAAFERLDAMPYWADIRIPTLLVKGELSPRITPEMMVRVRERAPQVRDAVVPGSDHHVTLDNPRGFIEVVNSFLSDTEDGTRPTA